MHTRTIATPLILALALFLPVSAAKADETAIEKGVAAAEAWLTFVDRGEFDKSWENSATLFRNAVTQEQWRQKISAVRGPLGKRVWRKVILTKYETALPGAPDGQYVIVQFKTVFENKANSVETVTPMKDPDGEWRVSGYLIK